MIRVREFYGACAFVLILIAGAAPVAAQQPASIAGTVMDVLGSRVPDATVTLTDERGQSRETTSGPDGSYAFDNVAPGRYQVTATARGFRPFTSGPSWAGAGARLSVDATLQIGPFQQGVVVTAAARAISQAQTGAPVTVLDETTLDALRAPDVLEALRLVPGAQVVQTGARGGATSLFIRGGNANFNKVLIDGAVANDIGGGFDFAQLPTTGIERVEVMRQTNSVMYGSDALAGVVRLTSKRGRTRTPEFTYAADAGNLGTWSSDAGLGGVARRLDYYSAYRRFETDNDLPNSAFTNGTYAGRFGAAVGGSTSLSGTIRRTDTRTGNPNAFSLYRIADDSIQTTAQTYVSLVADTMVSDRWQATVRFGNTDQTLHYVNPTPTGEPSDPFGLGVPNYLGDPVTLTGAHGYAVRGRAILDFGGTYPSRFDSRTTRRALSGETTYRMNATLSVSAGGRYEREQGYDDPTATPSATRNNGGAFGEVRLTLRNRHYISGGVGIEHNAVFGEAVTPRLSVASYLRQPSASGMGDTKLVLNAGTGIKAPTVFQASSSVYELLQGTGAAAGVDPIGPERSRSVDIGVEQGLAGNRARLRVAYFYNSFSDLIEFLSRTALVRAGVPPEAASATPFGGYVNSQSYRAQGAEVSFEAEVGRDLRVMASYTRLNAKVTEAFGESASFNPAFPDIPIGAFSPLVGARPFRRPPNSGSFMVLYAPGKAQVSMAAFFSGTRDDSTFLSDEFFGNSLLLPNTGLDKAYQKVDLSGSYQVHPRLRGYAAVENLFDQRYEAAFGFPALPITARVGVVLTLGGEAGRP